MEVRITLKLGVKIYGTISSLNDGCPVFMCLTCLLDRRNGDAFTAWLQAGLLSHGTQEGGLGGGGGLACGPQHLKPIRERFGTFHRVPSLRSTLARGHRKGLH
jgi:hypothetical protein